MARKLIVPKEDLIPLINEGLSIVNIGKRLNIGKHTIRHFIRKYGLKTKRDLVRENANMLKANNTSKCLKCEKALTYTQRKFCSHSCSAKHNNSVSPKRILTRKCNHCDKIVKSYRHTLCEKHLIEYNAWKGKEIGLRTIGEYRARVRNSSDRTHSFNSRISSLARTWFKHLKEVPCANCGYSKNVQLCHIKAIKDYPDTALVNEVNSPENIIQLCPNCHWELDRMDLTIEKIKKSEFYNPDLYQ